MRRKFAIVSLLSTGITLGYLHYITWLIGFAIAKYLGGKTEGKPGRLKSIVIPLRKYELHLHHWFISLVIGVISAVKGIYFVSPEIFYGFLGGLVFQGTYCYNDWYKIVKPRQYQEDCDSISQA